MEICFYGVRVKTSTSGFIFENFACSGECKDACDDSLGFSMYRTASFQVATHRAGSGPILVLGLGGNQIGSRTEISLKLVLNMGIWKCSKTYRRVSSPNCVCVCLCVFSVVRLVVGQTDVFCYSIEIIHLIYLMS